MPQKKNKNGPHNYLLDIILCGPICTGHNHLFKTVPVSVEKLYLPCLGPLTVYKNLETQWYQPLKIHKAAIFATESC